MQSNRWRSPQTEVIHTFDKRDLILWACLIVASRWIFDIVYRLELSFSKQTSFLLPSDILAYVVLAWQILVLVRRFVDWEQARVFGYGLAFMPWMVLLGNLAASVISSRNIGFFFLSMLVFGCPACSGKLSGSAQALLHVQRD